MTTERGSMVIKGDKLLCIANEASWEFGGQTITGPKNGDVVKVEKVIKGGFFLEGYNQQVGGIRVGYPYRMFRYVVSKGMDTLLKILNDPDTIIWPDQFDKTN